MDDSQHGQVFVLLTDHLRGKRLCQTVELYMGVARIALGTAGKVASASASSVRRIPSKSSLSPRHRDDSADAVYSENNTRLTSSVKMSRHKVHTKAEMIRDNGKAHYPCESVSHFQRSDERFGSTPQASPTMQWLKSLRFRLLMNSHCCHRNAGNAAGKSSKKDDSVNMAIAQGATPGPGGHGMGRSCFP